MAQKIKIHKKLHYVSLLRGKEGKEKDEMNVVVVAVYQKLYTPYIFAKKRIFKSKVFAFVLHGIDMIRCDCLKL